MGRGGGVTCNPDGSGGESGRSPVEETLSWRGGRGTPMSSPYAAGSFAGNGAGTEPQRVPAGHGTLHGSSVESEEDGGWGSSSFQSGEGVQALLGFFGH